MTSTMTMTAPMAPQPGVQQPGEPQPSGLPPPAEAAAPERAAVAGDGPQPLGSEAARLPAPLRRAALGAAKLGAASLWPLVGLLGFLALWAVGAPRVDTSLGSLPGPVAVAEAGVSLVEDYRAAQTARADFLTAQAARNAQFLAAGRPDLVQDFAYAGAPTFVDQILTSLKTVALGFLLATLVAVPVGLVCGLSRRANAAIGPLVQIMKPVSPLAWLPIVTMVVSATLSGADPLMAKAFVISAVVVMLCSRWPTLINTAVGVSSIDKDLVSVGRVLRLGWFAKLTKLVLPSALPYIFTGMRLSLGVGWMVLIAAEMLAQNPGLGKFVWDEFQNGSSQSLARIMVAVIVIGVIGFLLDRLMMGLEAAVTRRGRR